MTPPFEKKQPDIIVIPEKFYGVALRLDSKTEAESATPPPAGGSTPVSAPVPVAVPMVMTPPPSSWRQRLPMILIVVGLVLFIGGGFVYLNRQLIFGKKPQPQISQPAVISTPSQPTSLTATSTAPQSVSLAWLDTATNEDGYRIERQQTGGSFLVLTNVPSGSEAFLDVTAQSGQTYVYRIIAVNGGGESAPSEEATAVVKEVPQTVGTPLTPSLPPGGLDSDSDGLTDIEEPLYKTDLNNPDTDKDGFLDGNEVFHLYNPSAQAPVRLVDSGALEIVTSTNGWSIWVPAYFKTEIDPTNPTRYIFSVGTVSAEKMYASVETNPDRLPLRDWYAAKFPAVPSTSVRSVATRDGAEGIMGPDRLSAYFSFDDKILALSYDLSGQPFINYRTTYEMILNSLSLPRP